MVGDGGEGISEEFGIVEEGLKKDVINKLLKNR